jgi:hypothetical protein
LSGSRRILYQRDDPIARDLAERIVALASADPEASAEAAAIDSAVPGLLGAGQRLIAEGVSESVLLSSIGYGDDVAYVVSVPRRPADPCYEAGTLLRRAPWLSIPDVDLSETLVPLVDTRRHAIVKGGVVGLAVDWFGGILILNESLPER